MRSTWKECFILLRLATGKAALSVSLIIAPLHGDVWGNEVQFHAFLSKAQAHMLPHSVPNSYSPIKVLVAFFHSTEHLPRALFRFCWFLLLLRKSCFTSHDVSSRLHWPRWLFLFQIKYAVEGRKTHVREVLSSCFLVIGVPTPLEVYMRVYQVWNGFTWYPLLSFIELKTEQQKTIFLEPINRRC
jgi:hypothetical protein